MLFVCDTYFIRYVEILMIPEMDEDGSVFDQKGKIL